MYGGQNSHIPIKVNMSGVLPIIFASTLAMIPTTIAQFFPNLYNASVHPVWSAILSAFSPSSWAYAVIYFVLIIAFNYFYVAIQYNPVEIANNLRNNSGTIPGYRPGKPTSDFITKVLGKITFIGAMFLGIVAIFPIVPGHRYHRHGHRAGRHQPADCGGRGAGYVAQPRELYAHAPSQGLPGISPGMYFNHVRGKRQ